MIATLDRQQLRSVAPSIFAATPWERVSTNYRFVPTYTVLDILADMGFSPMMAAQSRCRIEGKAAFTKHMIRLRHREYIDNPRADMPELVLVNSHDRSSAYKFYSGVFRMVCQNGMIVAAEDFGSIAVKHSGSLDLTQQIIETTHRIAEDAPRHSPRSRPSSRSSSTRPARWRSPPPPLSYATAHRRWNPPNSSKHAARMTSRMGTVTAPSGRRST